MNGGGRQGESGDWRTIVIHDIQIILDVHADVPALNIEVGSSRLDLISSYGSEWGGLEQREPALKTVGSVCPVQPRSRVKLCTHG